MLCAFETEETPPILFGGRLSRVILRVNYSCRSLLLCFVAGLLFSYFMKGRKGDDGYIWSIYGGNELKLMPLGNRIVYFVHRKRGQVRPLSALDRDERSLLMPPPSVADVWKKFSIQILGYADHTKGYYHSRVNASFHDMLVVEKGVLAAKFGGKRVKLVRGDALVIPRGNLCDNFVNNTNTSVWWFHFADIPYWSDGLGSEVAVKTIESFGTLSALMRAFLEEAFSPSADNAVLENIASSVVAVLRREFSPVRSGDSAKAAVALLLKKIAENPCADWDIAVQSRRLSMSPRTLDNYCARNFSRTFGRYLRDCRMDEALKLIRAGAKNSEIAKTVGYADAYSFSKAVKAHFGKSPRELKRDFCGR